MEIRLVKHETNGLGYSVEYERLGILKVRFLGNIMLPLTFKPNAFEKGYLIDLGYIGDTENNKLYS